MPKQKIEAPPQLVAPMTACGERPPTEFVGSPAAGGVLNCYSLSRPHW